MGIVKSGCARLRRARGGRAGPVRAHRGDLRQGGDAFGAWPPRPRRARRGRLAQGRQTPEGGGPSSMESGQIRIRRRRVREPRHRRPAGGARRPEAPLPRGRPVRRRRHRARQQGPEEGARLSAGVRRPRPAPPRARPMRLAARRGDGASGAGLHGPRGVRECGYRPREKRLAGRRGSAAGSDAPSSPAISATPSPSARRRLIYEMADMPAISLPASLDRLPKQRPKWANRGEWPAPLPMRRKKRRERRNSYLANP